MIHSSKKSYFGPYFIKGYWCSLIHDDTYSIGFCFESECEEHIITFADIVEIEGN